MRLPMLCTECCFNVVPQGDTYPTYVEFRDDSCYEFTCSRGHRNITILQQQKFEILFQIGAYAIVDGYYREAVASFTSSLERFYEFFIKAKLLEEGNTPENLELIWKTVSSQSERQLGAFIFLYSQTFKEAPQLLPSSRVTFRNEVIHKGKIPTREEALSYGQAVIDTIKPVIKLTTSTFPTGVKISTINHLVKNTPTGTNAGTTSMPTIISVLSAMNEEPQRSLAEEIESLSSWRSMFSN
ncbi:hypothetical protein [Pseudomonas sp. S2_H08]